MWLTKGYDDRHNDLRRTAGRSEREQNGARAGPVDAGSVPGLREAEPEASRLLEAALAWELATGRKAMVDDEGAVRDRRRLMDEATAGKESSSTKE